jgi:metal-responsive CopG/Arc/MetJ family transcriptional regulator
MDRQDVILSLQADLLRDIERMATERGVSLSRFITFVLETAVEEQQRYQAARERQLALMEAGLPLGTHGHIIWTREELHER